MARFELDEIAHPYRLLDEEMEAGEKVRERVLERQGNGEAADAQGRDERRYRYAEDVQDDQHADHDHRALQHPAHEGRRGDGDIQLLTWALKDLPIMLAAAMLTENTRITWMVLVP